jgi:hypothetical protein
VWWIALLVIAVLVGAVWLILPGYEDNPARKKVP